MQIVDCLRVNIKFSPLSKMFISQARQLFYRTIKSCEHHFYASQSIYTQNFKKYSFVVTDLLMARTRLRLGENLACVVYLHRWNYHKHLVFYSVVMQSINFFFFLTHEIIWKTKRKKGIGTDFTESHKSRETLTNNYLLYFIPKKKDILSKLNLKISLSKIKKKIYVLRF